MHHIDIYLDKWSNFDQKSKFPWQSSIKNWGFQLKMAGGESRDKKLHKIEKLTALTWRPD